VDEWVIDERLANRPAGKTTNTVNWTTISIQYLAPAQSIIPPFHTVKGTEVRTLILLGLCATLAACAARSTVKLADPQAVKLAPHTGKVCMLRSPLPADVKHKVVGNINSAKQTYGSVEELLPLMAADARAVGADAVVSLNTGQRIGAWAWARPVGTGVAVKLDNKEAFNCTGSGGEWR
jgi:hypothetical protein